MGTHLHRVVIVTSNNEKLIERAHATAVGIFSAARTTFATSALRLLVGPITPGIVNGFRTFCIVPDGSKLGWPDSDAAEATRAEFLAWCEAQRYDDGSTSLDYVHVQFGGDDDIRSAVLTSSDSKDEP